MNKTLVLIGAFSTLGILLSGCSPRPADMNATVSPSPETMLEQTDATRMSPTPVEASDSATMTYSLAEVSQHASATDCWTVIRGEVYNPPLSFRNILEELRFYKFVAKMVQNYSAANMVNNNLI